jgi:hypothetical protein
VKDRRDLVPGVLVELTAEQLAARDAFRARVDLLLVELGVAARNLGAGERSAEVAERALELLVEAARR